jgi:hypothetical protein
MDVTYMAAIMDMATCDDCFQSYCSNNSDICEYKRSEGSCPLMFGAIYD